MSALRVLKTTTCLTNFFSLREMLWPQPDRRGVNEGVTYRRTFMSPNVTTVAIIYGKKSGHVRQHVYSETDDSEYHPSIRNLQHNEAMCFVPMAFHYAGHAAFHWAIREAVFAHGGLRAVMFPGEPGSRMFAQVNRRTGIVENIAMADPDVPGDLAVILRDNWIEHEFGAVKIGDVWLTEQRMAA